jgi:hypothetical protein
MATLYTRVTMLRFLGSAKAARIMLVIVSVGIILRGTAYLLNGRLEYLGYRGFYVFVPYTILLGVIGLVAVFRVKPSSSASRKSDRIRGWPTTKTRDHRKPHKRLKSKHPTY